MDLRCHHRPTDGNNSDYVVQILEATEVKEKRIEQKIGSKPQAIGSEPIDFEFKTEANGFEPHSRTTGIQVPWGRRSAQVGKSHTGKAPRIERGLIATRVQ
jgi:hypothetical protein